MARFAIVAPPDILEHLDATNVLEDTHLLLAHDVVKQPFRYSNLFDDEMRPHQDSRLVIMDNSVIELGNAVDLHMIEVACELTRPTCVVLPDVMLDGPATTISCTDAVDVWQDLLCRGKNKDMSFMFVPQGKTIHEFVKCAESLCDNHAIGYWGVPRNLVKTLGSRFDAIKLLSAINPYRWIHMLGFSDDMIDDVICAREFEVGSIDSAVPLRLRDRLTLSGVPSPRGDWWENAEFHDNVIPNLRTARGWFHT